MAKSRGRHRAEDESGTGQNPMPLENSDPAASTTFFPATAAREDPPAAAPPRRGAPHRAGGAPSLLTEDDLFLFNEGTHYRLYEKLGAHVVEAEGRRGTYFAVWAPNAEFVSVAGDFNGWNREAAPLRARGSSGIWEGFVEGVGDGALYKYHIRSRHNGYRVDKADPFGSMHEGPPKTASIVKSVDYQWTDGDWMRTQGELNRYERPIAIYEMHLGSWRRHGDRPLTYLELAETLPGYLKEQGFTHVEFLPIMEHPFYGSWGYQTTGYFAPSSRFGTPQEFMALVDALHRAGVGVILDWVPSHFPNDEHGLAYFDGTHLFEHADPKQGFHPDWKSAVFNYGRNEVRAFLISSAMIWLDKYHIDGLRVDAVASMLYLDYSRGEGEWVPNKYGGRENLEAIEFLRQFNIAVYQNYPGVHTIAEESTAWPMVSRPTYIGGLGFGFKWDMGWMHDTLQYMSREPVHRKFHHNELTFRGLYMFSENYVLPLSHDEVVHGKGSLLARMTGDEWQRFANLRLLLACMYAQPGKKLLFMGAEIGQSAEWSHESGLEWHLLQYPPHAGVHRLVRELNRIYMTEPALHWGDCKPEGYQWLEGNDAENSVLAFLRRGWRREDQVVCIFNFTPVPRQNYRVGAPAGGVWREILNTDAAEFWGSGVGNAGRVEAAPVPWHGQPNALTLTLPPLGALFLKPGEA